MLMTYAMTRPAGAAAAGLSGGLLALALLTGCSHGSNSADKPSTKPSTGVKAPAPTADTIANDPKARPSVSMRDCAATGSGWSAGGTVTNSKDKDATFTIVVSFTTKQSPVLARGETKLTVKAGATTSWSTDANFAKTKGPQCV